MGPTESKIVAEFLVAEFEREIPTTVRVFEAVPERSHDYRPDAKSKTGLELVRHIALEDDWLLNGIADGAFAPQPDGSDACGIMRPADAVARYRTHVPLALARVRAMSGDELTSTLDLLGVVQAPAIAILAMALKHSVHHRGQLATYLRAMGSTVPGIYGPTADVQPATAGRS